MRYIVSSRLAVPPSGDFGQVDQSRHSNRDECPPKAVRSCPHIFWYGGIQGIMKLTAGQCPALLTAIGKEIRDLWHGFKTFVTGDYTEIDMGQNVGKTAEEKNR